MEQNKPKRRLRIVESIALAVTSACALALPAQAVERVQAPVATFTLQHYTAKPTTDLDDLAKYHARVERLKHKDGRPSRRSDALHAWILSELMEPGWTVVEKNTVTTVGKNDLLTQYFKGSSYTAAWYCGLISSTSYSAISAADTMSSHAGWLEAGAANAPTYSQSTRVALTFGTASAGSLATSSASSFTFTGSGTIKGMFGTTVSTKDGTTGILYNAVLFTGGDRAVVNTDVVNVSVTYSA